MSGQYSDPLRVITFNPQTDRAEDVSHAIGLRYCVALTCGATTFRQS
jgi:hypothetical protein